PAFRTIIEAWASSYASASASTITIFPSGTIVPSNTIASSGTIAPSATVQMNDSNRLNVLARELFGQFVPDLRYPSLSDIASTIARIVETATYQVARNSQDMLSEAFVEAYRAILSISGEDASNPTDDIISEIHDLQNKLEKNEILSSHSSQS